MSRRFAPGYAVPAAGLVLAGLLALLAVLSVPTDATADAGDGEAESGEDEAPPEPTLSLSVTLDDLVGTSWRPVGMVTSSIEGSTSVGDSASSDEIDPDAAAEAERSLEDLGAERTPDGLVVTLPETVLFEFDSTDLIGDADETLDNVAEVLRYYDEVEIEIHGHTDSRGEDDYNQQLSEDRAEAVRDRLASAGVQEGRMEAIGFGATDPVAPNETPDGEDDPEGRQQNRRVEVLLREE